MSAAGATTRAPAGSPPLRVPWRARLAGDLGPVPILAGLVVIWAVFQALNANYLTSRNLSNLVLQMGVVGVLALGVVLVLIIGEIDLSLGATAGVAAGVMGIGLTQRGWPVGLAIAAAVLVGAAIGLLQGAITVAVGVPSFIVTLGGLLAWQGVQLGLLGDLGELRITDPFVRGLTNAYVPPALAWGLLAAAVAVHAALRTGRELARRREGLAPRSWPGLVARLVAVAVAGAVLVAYLQRYFGVPWVLVILLALTAALTWLTRRTPFGRHLYAIGANAEAARRAGIAVQRTKVIVFVLTSALAGSAGVIAASRQFAVSTGTGGGTLLLEAIAAAVIGGTSLFGGRGRPYQALLGALVITSVANGLNLLGQPSSVKNVATGAILVLSVSIDAVTRGRRAASSA